MYQYTDDNAFVLSHSTMIAIYTFENDTINKVNDIQFDKSDSYQIEKIFYKNNLLYVLPGKNTNFYQNMRVYKIDEENWEMTEEKQQINFDDSIDQKQQEIYQYGLVEYCDNIIIIGGVNNSQSILFFNIHLRKWMKSSIV